MTTRYVYTPEKEYIYLYKDKPVTTHYSTGQLVVFDLQGRYVEDMPQYSDEADQVSEEPIGIIIRPRWKKQELVWQTVQRGIKYDKLVHT